MTVHSNSDGRRDHPPTPPMDAGDDSFEFFSFCRSPPAMCAADDVFLAGRILPFGAPPPHRSTECRRRHHHHPQPPQENPAEVFEAARPSRRFWAGRGGAAKANANYRRLAPASDTDVAAKSFPPPPQAASTAKQRPKWYLYVLGSMRVPATMDLSDMRSRQQRRRCPQPQAEAGEPSVTVDANRGTWKLLRSLSCKGVESAGVSVTFVRDLQGV